MIRATVTFAHLSGLPEDRMTNTFHALDTVALDAAEAFAEDLYSFYAAGTTPLYTFFSTLVPQSGHSIRFYDLGEPEPRVPIYEYPFSLPGAPNGDPLPSEVALVGSFQAEKVSGQSQARRRNRIYVGRLDKDSASAGRPSSSLMGSLNAAMDGLEAASTADPDYTWAVWSPTYSTQAPVDNGWVDNAFDTQRRRGEAATSRVTWSS